MLSPISSKITVTKEKERRKRSSEEKERTQKKAMLALLVFIIATLEIVFGQNKKLLDGKGPFGDNVFKNPARYTCSYTLL